MSKRIFNKKKLQKVLKIYYSKWQKQFKTIHQLSWFVGHSVGWVLKKKRFVIELIYLKCIYISMYVYKVVISVCLFFRSKLRNPWTDFSQILIERPERPAVMFLVECVNFHSKNLVSR